MERSQSRKGVGLSNAKNEKIYAVDVPEGHNMAELLHVELMAGGPVLAVPVPPGTKAGNEILFKPPDDDEVRCSAPSAASHLRPHPSAEVAVAVAAALACCARLPAVARLTAACACEWQEDVEVLMKGMLAKKSPKGIPGAHKWQKRHFELQPTLLGYWELNAMEGAVCWPCSRALLVLVRARTARSECGTARALVHVNVAQRAARTNIAQRAARSAQRAARTNVAQRVVRTSVTQRARSMQRAARSTRDCGVARRARRRARPFCAPMARRTRSQVRKGRIELCDMVGVRAHQREAKRFDILLTSKRLFELKAETEKERDEWVNKLNAAIITYLSGEAGAPGAASSTASASGSGAGKASRPATFDFDTTSTSADDLAASLRTEEEAKAEDANSEDDDEDGDEVEELGTGLSKRTTTFKEMSIKSKSGGGDDDDDDDGDLKPARTLTFRTQSIRVGKAQTGNIEAVPVAVTAKYASRVQRAKAANAVKRQQSSGVVAVAQVS